MILRQAHRDRDKLVSRSLCLWQSTKRERTRNGKVWCGVCGQGSVVVPTRRDRTDRTDRTNRIGEWL